MDPIIKDKLVSQIQAEVHTASQATQASLTKVAAKTHYMLLLTKSPYHDILPRPVILNEAPNQYEEQYFTRFRETAEQRMYALLARAQSSKVEYAIVPIQLPGFQYEV